MNGDVRKRDHVARSVRAISGFMLVMGLLFLRAETAPCADQNIQKSNIKTKIQIFADSLFEPSLPGFGLHEIERVTRDAVLKRFGQPLKATSRKGSDIQEPGIFYDILTWEYPGMIITMAKEDHEKKDNYWVDEIILTSSDYRLKFGLRIGQPRTSFLKEFGKPRESFAYLEEKAGTLVYRVENLVTIDGTPMVSCPDIAIEFDESDLANKIRWAAGSCH